MGSIIAINKESLDENRYFISLMHASVQKGLLEMDLLKSTSQQLNEILKDLIYRYTKGESTTLKTETVEDLMKSMVYALDLLFMQFPTAEEAIAKLKSSDIKKLYQDAITYLKTFLQDTKQLYETIEAKRVLLPNAVYNETFSEAIPNFLASYDVYYSAQDTSCDMDYPLTIDHSSTSGILFIRRYLETFALENEFCLKFSQQNILNLLRAYGKANRIHFQESPINIFELVFNNVIMIALLNRGYDNLFVSRLELEILSDRLHGLNKLQIQNTLSAALVTLTDQLEIDDINLISLMQEHAASMPLRLCKALEQGNFANMLVIEASPDKKEDIILELGRKMGNKDFRAVYNKIMNCSEIKDKMDIIAKYIHSLDDYIDLLKADCFIADEYSYIFDSLGDLELSVLIVNGLKEYLSRDKNELSELIEASISYQYDWEKAFVLWLGSLDKSRLKAIEQLVDKNLNEMML